MEYVFAAGGRKITSVLTGLEWLRVKTVTKAHIICSIKKHHRMGLSEQNIELASVRCLNMHRCCRQTDSKDSQQCLYVSEVHTVRSQASRPWRPLRFLNSRSPGYLGAIRPGSRPLKHNNAMNQF